jgi:hypothetical protein
MGEGATPPDQELREALLSVSVSDVLVQALGASVSIASMRIAEETRDLAQVRLAIESLRALEPVLRDGGVDGALVRDLEQARASLQLAYAEAVDPRPAAASSPSGRADPEAS